MEDKARKLSLRGRSKVYLGRGMRELSIVMKCSLPSEGHGWQGFMHLSKFIQWYI